MKITIDKVFQPPEGYKLEGVMREHYDPSNGTKEYTFSVWITKKDGE